MNINLLYWKSIWNENMKNVDRQHVYHAHTKEEEGAFMRRLLELEGSTFTKIAVTRH